MLRSAFRSMVDEQGTGMGRCKQCGKHMINRCMHRSRQQQNIKKNFWLLTASYLVADHSIEIAHHKKPKHQA
jgi:hypothetical protein